MNINLLATTLGISAYLFVASCSSVSESTDVPSKIADHRSVQPIGYVRTLPGNEIGSKQRVIVAIWENGEVVWSSDADKPGEYFQGSLSAESLSRLMRHLDRAGLSRIKEFSFAFPDESTTEVGVYDASLVHAVSWTGVPWTIKSGDHAESIRSWLRVKYLLEQSRPGTGFPVKHDSHAALMMSQLFPGWEAE